KAGGLRRMVAVVPGQIQTRVRVCQLGQQDGIYRSAGDHDSGRWLPGLLCNGTDSVLRGQYGGPGGGGFSAVCWRWCSFSALRWKGTRAGSGTTPGVFLPDMAAADEWSKGRSGQTRY